MSVRELDTPPVHKQKCPSTWACQFTLRDGIFGTLKQMAKKKIDLLAKSIKRLTREGYVCDRTEHYNFFTNRTNDFFGVIDAICCRPNEILAVQTTSHSNASSHRKKIALEPRTRVWLEAGGKFQLHLFKKVGRLWTLKIEEIV